MALAEESSGTQAAVINTEHTLAAPTTAKTRVLIVDLAAMASGDTVELRIKQKVLTAGAEGLAVLTTFVNAQADPIAVSVPIAQFRGATFTLKQTTGTGRSFPWQVLVLD